MAARIRKGDKVIVITGKDKGRTGEVLRVFPDDNRAVVQVISARRHPPRAGSSARRCRSTCLTLLWSIRVTTSRPGSVSAPPRMDAKSATPSFPET